MMKLYLDTFFFQAEDGIRDETVTGVQTCALPISKKFSIRYGERDILERRDGREFFSNVADSNHKIEKPSPEEDDAQPRRERFSACSRGRLKASNRFRRSLFIDFDDRLPAVIDVGTVHSGR